MVLQFDKSLILLKNEGVDVMELKLHDVYKFNYNDEWRKKIFDVNWCFDGQLIVKENCYGDLYLRDTYWTSGEGKEFTLEQALERGVLTFICNLNDLESIEARDLNYYADEDIFDLSYQRKMNKDYYIRKGAKKSKDKMELVLNEKIKSIESNIESSIYNLEWTKEKLEKLKSGDMNIYI